MTFSILPQSNSKHSFKDLPEYVFLHGKWSDCLFGSVSLLFTPSTGLIHCRWNVPWHHTLAYRSRLMASLTLPPPTHTQGWDYVKNMNLKVLATKLECTSWGKHSLIGKNRVEDWKEQSPHQAASASIHAFIFCHLEVSKCFQVSKNLNRIGSCRLRKTSLRKPCLHFLSWLSTLH